MHKNQNLLIFLSSMSPIKSQKVCRYNYLSVIVGWCFSDSVLQYHFHRIFWQNPEQQIILGDMDVNHTSVVSPARATIFLLRHHSLHPYPGKAPESGHLINKAHWLPLWGTAIDCTMKEYSTVRYAKCEKIPVTCQKASCKKTMYKNGKDPASFWLLMNSP